MSDDEDDVCLHKGVRVPNGPYLSTPWPPSYLSLPHESPTSDPEE